MMHISAQFQDSTCASDPSNIEKVHTDTPFIHSIPSANVDLVIHSNVHGQLSFNENQNLKVLLSSHKRAILFAVPGAFTPTCSGKHLPGYIEKMSALKAKGVEAVYCLSVNDRFVMKAWAEQTAGCIESEMLLVADGNGDFTKAMGMSLDRSSNRMGMRSKRYAMIVEEGKIKQLLVDESGLQLTSAEHILTLLD